MTDVSLAETLALLAYDPDGVARGTLTDLDCGLAGALLAELALTGRIGIAGRHVAVVDATPTGHPLLDDTLRRLGRDRPRSPRDWTVRLTPHLTATVLDRLVATGTLRHEPGRLMKVFPRDRYPSPDGAEPPARARARERMRDAVTAAGPVDARTAALCGLAGALGWAARVVPGQPAKRVEQRCAELGASVWAARVVRQVRDDARTARTAAAEAAAG